MKDATHFVTFGQGSIFRNHYVTLTAGDMAEARDNAYSAMGQSWAFVYPIEELADQQKRFGIRHLGTIVDRGHSQYEFLEAGRER